MNWKPDKRQIDLIADHCAANISLAATAAALDIRPDTLRAVNRQACSNALQGCS